MGSNNGTLVEPLGPCYTGDMKTCNMCSRPATQGARGGWSYCDEHREYMRVYTNQRYHRLKAEGKCRSCQGPLNDEKSTQYCAECAPVWRETRRTPAARKATNRYRQHIRTKALSLYGNVCAECGAAVGRLELHHVDQAGKEERASEAGKNVGSYHTQRRVVLHGKDPNLTLLCVRCHRAQHNLLTRQ